MRGECSVQEPFLNLFNFLCPERHENSQKDWKAGTTGKPERPESRNYRKAGTTGKPELPESRNDRKAGTTGKLERAENCIMTGNPE
jgi:hypothetical protein